VVTTLLNLPSNAYQLVSSRFRGADVSGKLSKGEVPLPKNPLRHKSSQGRSVPHQLIGNLEKLRCFTESIISIRAFDDILRSSRVRTPQV